MRMIVIVIIALLIAVIGNSALQVITYHNSRHNCLQTELLKQRVRNRAVQEYQRLPENARLLGIKLTPELQRAEKKALNRVLNDYAPERCAGIFG